MCGWFRKDEPEPLQFTRGEVARILDRTPVHTRLFPDGSTVTVLRSGEIIRARPDA